MPDWTPNASLALIEQHGNDFTTPNVDTSYSNSEYILLGFVIQKVTGESAEVYINTLLKRFKLEHTSFPATVALPVPFAHGYLDNVATLRDVSLSNPKVPWTAGGMISTVPDMLTYAKELGTGIGLSSASFKMRQAWRPLRASSASQYGLGIAQQGQWIGHYGSMLGYTNEVFYLPSARASVVVMVNAGGRKDWAYGSWREIVDALYPGTLDR